MRLRIVSDGEFRTKVTNADTGEMVEGVVGIGWQTDRSGKPRAVITLVGVEADVIADSPGMVAAVSRTCAGPDRPDFVASFDTTQLKG